MDRLCHSLISTDETERQFRLHGPNRLRSFSTRRQARPVVGLGVHLPVEHPATQLEELGPLPLAASAFQGGLADVPAGGQLLLIEVRDFHLGFLPNELTGVHEGAVAPASQVFPSACHSADGSFNS